jgi:hypothetical protein
MTHLKTLFDGLEWWRLRPAAREGFVRSTTKETVNAARSVEGDLALVYLARGGDLVLNSQMFAGSTARWYDPSSGRWTVASDLSTGTEGLRFTPPRPANDAGFDDWVLVLTKP